MSHPPLLPWAVLVSAAVSVASIPAFGQAIVSTHSGIVYFFEGSVSINGQPLQQKFGRFPDIGDGNELRTSQGRAEVLLTPGVFLRIDRNSAVRLLSSELSNTQVELLDGSAIMETDDTAPGTSVTMFYKNWRVRVPANGTYRIDTQPEQVRVYRGEAGVSTAGSANEEGNIHVTQGQVLPLAAVLVPEPSPAGEIDSFKAWAMSRSRMISADNATAAAITDDPNTAADPAGALAGITYFPVTGVPSLGVATPYGGSFWAPFQYGLEYGLNSTYLSPYFTGVPYIGWPLGSRSRFIQPNPVYIPSTRVGSPAYRTTHIQPVVPYTAPRPVYSPPRSIYTPSSTRMAMPVPRGGAARPAGRR